MFKEKTVQELTEAMLVDIQQKVGFKINMNKLMWRLYAQAKHIIENSNKEYRDLAVLYHIADEGNRAYLLVNTTVDFDVTSYDYLINTIQFGYNLPVIIHGQEIVDIMTKLVYTHARNIGYDYFVRKDEANLEEIDMDSEEVNIESVSARRITNDVRREFMIHKEATARQLKEENYSNADIAEEMGIDESSVRALLDPWYKAKDDTVFAEVNVKSVSEHRIAKDATRREERIEKEATARQLEEENLSNADIAELMDINEVSVRSLLDPSHKAKNDVNDAKHRNELVEKVQWYTLYGFGAVLLVSIGLIIYTYVFNR